MADFLPSLLCSFIGHNEDRHVYEHCGYDSTIGLYSRWVVRCTRCRGVLDSGTILDSDAAPAPEEAASD